MLPKSGETILDNFQNIIILIEFTLKLLSQLHLIHSKIPSYQVIFLADKFPTDITRFYLISIKPRCSKSIILNIDDSKDMSISIRSTNLN